MQSEMEQREGQPHTRILIVEDDPEFGALLAEILEMSGFSTSRAPDGLAALELLETKGRPDLIMLDLTMPRMNGWQFRQEQRRRPELASIPVIVMSGNGPIDTALSEMRADGYVMKPPHIAIILREIRRVVDGPKPNGERAAVP